MQHVPDFSGLWDPYYGIDLVSSEFLIKADALFVPKGVQHPDELQYLRCFLTIA